MMLPAADLGPPAGGATRDGGEVRAMDWHPDPWQRHQLRFHDGEQWTEHVADGGFAGLDSTPVADLPRSHPPPARSAPPAEGDGPRVVPDADRHPASLDSELLLLAGGAGPRRALLGPDDSPAGWVERPRPRWPRRAARALVPSPSTAVTRLVVTDATGAERLRLDRPARRMAPVVDLSGADGVRGRIRAESVRQGLRADVLVGDEVVGRLEEVGRDGIALRVVDRQGVPRARLTAVWDVPGRRRHLAPGVMLVDRHTPDGGRLDTDRGLVLLGALLSAELLLPPPPPA